MSIFSPSSIRKREDSNPEIKNFIDIICNPDTDTEDAKTAWGKIANYNRAWLPGTLQKFKLTTEERDDVCQDTLILAMNNIHQLKNPNAFLGWMKRIAINQTKNLIMRRAPDSLKRAFDISSIETTTCEESPIASIITNETRDAVFDAIQMLPEIYKSVILDFYVEEKGVLDIANERDIPDGTVKRRLHTARKKLREILEAEFMREDL